MLLRIPRFQSVECLFLFSFLCGSLFLLKLLIQSRLTKSLEMPFGSSTKSHKVQEGALMWLIQWYTMIKWYKMTYKMLHKSLCWQLQLDETPPAVLGTSFPEPLPGPVACRFMSLHFASWFIRSSWEVHEKFITFHHQLWYRFNLFHIRSLNSASSSILACTNENHHIRKAKNNATVPCRIDSGTSASSSSASLASAWQRRTSTNRSSDGSLNRWTARLPVFPNLSATWNASWEMAERWGQPTS